MGVADGAVVADVQGHHGVLRHRLNDRAPSLTRVGQVAVALARFLVPDDDTGTGHAHRDGITTQIGGSRFSVFRTGRSKSRLNFLSLLRAGQEDYIINDAALDYMRHRKVAPDVITRLAAHPKTSFASQMAWYDHLVRLRLDVFDRTLMREITEAALWGAVRHHGLMGNTVVVSDDAGQFRIPDHALCWVHAERLLQKLMPKTT